MKKVSLLFLLFCLPLFIAACNDVPREATVGYPAPDFTLMDRQGKSWTLSELKGQVVFINFWATWCSPCREEMPSMQNLYSKLPKDKFKMLAIVNRDNPSLADSFAEKLGITMPILDDQPNNIGRRFGITGLPETFIIDKQGVIREKYIGPYQWDSPQYMQLVMKYINQ